MIEFVTQSGTARGYLALPDSGSGQGVLLLHAWWGLNPFFMDLADRLAGEGFVVFAPDLNDGAITATVEDAKALMERRDYERLALTVLGAEEYLRARPEVRGSGLGLVGFSMGAGWSIWLSTERPDNIAAVVLFYGTQPADFTVARAAYLGHFSDQDEWEPLEGVRAMESEMRGAGRSVDFQTYPGVAHWFFEADRPQYDADAAQAAWRRTVAFLQQTLAA